MAAHYHVAFLDGERNVIRSRKPSWDIRNAHAIQCAETVQSSRYPDRGQPVTIRAFDSEPCSLCAMAGVATTHS